MTKTTKVRVNSNSKSVLVVDDNSINRRILGQFLKGLSLTVVEAKNGVEAIEILQKEDFCIVFMDIIMPLLDGYDASKKIRGLNIHTPIIAVTADTVEELTPKMIEHGMNDVLPKPFSKEQLKDLLLKHLNNGNCGSGAVDNTLPIFDTITFEEAYSDVSLRKDILETFIEEEKSDVNRITSSFDSKSNESVYKAVHYMKGSFSYLKASRILKMTQTILNLCKEGNMDEVLSLRDIFLTEYYKLLEEVKKY